MTSLISHVSPTVSWTRSVGLMPHLGYMERFCKVGNVKCVLLGSLRLDWFTTGRWTLNRSFHGFAHLCRWLLDWCPTTNQLRPQIQFCPATVFLALPSEKDNMIGKCVIRELYSSNSITKEVGHSMVVCACNYRFTQERPKSRLKQTFDLPCIIFVERGSNGLFHIHTSTHSQTYKRLVPNHAHL